MYREKLLEDTIRKLAWENVVVDGKMMIDKSTGDVLAPEGDYTFYKEKYLVNFIVFIDHKITCWKVEVLHTLSNIDTLNIWGTCYFL